MSFFSIEAIAQRLGELRAATAAVKPGAEAEREADVTVDLLRLAGLVSFTAGPWCLHLGVYPSHWVWGHETEAYDLCAECCGAGPLFLLVRIRTS